MNANDEFTKMNYRELMGQLNWPIVKDCPVLKFWHQSLCRFITKARNSHVKGAFQLLNWMFMHRDMSWTIRGSNVKDTKITIYCDSSNCDEKNTGHTSTCAMIFVDQSLVYMYCNCQLQVSTE